VSVLCDNVSSSASHCNSVRQFCTFRHYDVVESTVGDNVCRDSAVSVELLTTLCSCVQVIAGVVFYMRHFIVKFRRLGVRPIIMGSGISFWLIAMAAILWQQGPCLSEVESAADVYSAQGSIVAVHSAV
jgi:hypothetical protein